MLDLNVVLAECLERAFQRCRQWVEGKGVRYPCDKLDQAAVMAVLEEAMRQEVLGVLDGVVGSVTVYVGEDMMREGDEPPVWFISVFGYGIWSERFAPHRLFGASSEQGIQFTDLQEVLP